jgi:hypothetical protein
MLAPITRADDPSLDTQGEVRGLPDHHPKPIATGTDFRPLDLGNDQCRDTRGSVSDAKRRSSYGHLALLTYVRTSGRPGPGLLAHVIVSKYADGLPPSLAIGAVLWLAGAVR